MRRAVRKRQFVAAVVLVAVGIIAETAATAEQLPAPTGSTQLAFAGLTWQCKSACSRTWMTTTRSTSS